MKVRCNHCGTTRYYFPKDNKIPKRPRARCKNGECSKIIFVNRLQLETEFQKNMITKDHDEKYTEKMNDHDEKYQVLSLIDQNKYATQIAQITGFSVSKISRIINWLKDMKYIRSTFGKPIFYEVITKGKIYMREFLKKSKSKDSNDQDQDLIKI